MRVAALLLAAGGSTRLGSPKQLLLKKGQPLVRRMAQAALDAGCDPVAVVLGAEAVAVGMALDGLPLQPVLNPHWRQGMASSLRAGLEALPSGPVLILLCDQIAVDADLMGRLLTAHLDHPERVIACAYGGGLGVPALFPDAWREGLMVLEGDRGARALLPADAVALPFPEGVMDVDRLEDLSLLHPLD